MLALHVAACFLPPISLAAQHMDLPAVHWVSKRDSSLPLVINNWCGETIYPAVLTQAGNGPDVNGFKLEAGSTKRLSVSENWQGRVWGRTNCSFNSDGTGPSPAGGPNGNGAACLTGDCGGVVKCNLAGWPPATLAEFNLKTSSGQAFYDISLVDGYNLPMGIYNLFNESDSQKLKDIPPNLTNPICLGSGALITDTDSAPNKYFGSNKTYPIPLENKVSQHDVSRWCPWSLQEYPPSKPGDGVYPYPDDDIDRPAFDPCYSACAKSGSPEDCCSGAYNSPDKCTASDYAKAAKKVCPDAYSYAYDDQSSTFITPQGGGFGVTFCPKGRSSNIQATMGDEMRAIAAKGELTPAQLAVTQNDTYLQASSAAGEMQQRSAFEILLAVIVAALLM